MMMIMMVMMIIIIIRFKKEINPTSFFNSLKHSGWIYIVFKYYSIPKQASEVQVKILWLLYENSTTAIVFFFFYF
jgi:hypothetical protein